MFNRLALLGLVLLFACSEAKALSLSYLWGNTFRNDLGYKRKKLTQTLEHFQVWEYGNVFFYYDLTEPFSHQNGNDEGGYPNQYFGGMAPTFSLSKMTGKKWEAGWIKDVSIRLEWENGSGNGSNNFRNYFYGLQYDLAVPGFDFVSINTVLRDNPRAAGVGTQIGAFWQSTWDYGPWRRFKFTGFIAASPWDGDINVDQREKLKKIGVVFDKHARFLTTQPQFLWDVGYGMFGKPDRIETGFEYAYFTNRYTLAHKTEKVLQYMIKMTF